MALTSCQSLSSSATTPSILLEEPVCFSDIEDLEVCAYSSHVRTRRNSVDAQTDQQVKYSRNLEVRNSSYRLLGSVKLIQ